MRTTNDVVVSTRLQNTFHINHGGNLCTGSPLTRPPSAKKNTPRTERALTSSPLSSKPKRNKIVNLVAETRPVSINIDTFSALSDSSVPVDCAVNLSQSRVLLSFPCAHARIEGRPIRAPKEGTSPFSRFGSTFVRAEYFLTWPMQIEWRAAKDLRATRRKSQAGTL